MKGVKKIYDLGEVKVVALKNVNLFVKEKEHISIMGPSGSGKTTLLNIIGCLDKPTDGEYYLDGVDVKKLDDDHLSGIRNKKIGFVFQNYNLIPQLNVIENIGLPLIYRGIDEKEIIEKSKYYANLVGLGDRMYHRPTELSGGQQQRVAIARALVNEPVIILGDEPTGNLDTKTGKEIMEIFKKLNEMGRTIIIITHDVKVAEYGERIVKILDGEIIDER
ncbi:MAG: ABC transporter ATP-binding protein [Candidatus Omnitrophica bacterium]|nr:ABC transporter ATP-binding protein [Candidatus Omnitrophota bacterium]MCM8811359.1 ABC transporter ATP-binding protein [Candidatus Omnitrophota bacterium]MCM8833230.1 ABC transporter ATP-binding protein [Candidatus Omnitrophota bacterium]